MNLGIFNFPFSNAGSVETYAKTRGLTYEFIDSEAALGQYEILILPGVGTFGNAMDYLKINSFDIKIKSLYNSKGKTPILIGICLGMQLLFNSSEESPGVEGLMLVNGVCKQLPSYSGYLLPHIGWNSISSPKNQHIQFPDMYFVHSYHCIPDKNDDILFTSTYSTEFVSAVKRDNIFGFQFHPEKSGAPGYQMLDKILRLC